MAHRPTQALRRVIKIIGFLDADVRRRPIRGIASPQVVMRLHRTPLVANPHFNIAAQLSDVLVGDAVAIMIVATTLPASIRPVFVPVMGLRGPCCYEQGQEKKRI